MPNLSQLKRERMLAFLQKIKDEHRDDDDMLIALGEIESELTSKKYGLVWEQHEEAVDVMMRDNIPVFTEVPEREITAAPGQGYNFILEGDNLHSLRLLEKTHAKPVNLIKYLLTIANQPKDIIVLDCFAGSGTTGHAVLQLNEDDGGSRQFIICTNNEGDICETVTYPRVRTVITGQRTDGSTYSSGLPANVKYYRTDFVSLADEYLSDSLLEHIREMIQLEHGVKIDGSQYLMVMSDEEADELQAHWDEYEGVKAIYASKEVLFTTEQNALFAGVEIHTIPDYYFNFELKEVGETW